MFRTIGIENYADMEEAVACYATRAGEKLRRQNGEAGGIYVYVRTNPNNDSPQYARGIGGNFTQPTANSFELVAMAGRLLKEIFRDGFAYQKAGVMLLEMRTAGETSGAVQEGLFPADNKADARNVKLMAALDQINRQHGRGTLTIGAQGLDDRNWKLRSNHRSPRYTTRWDELPEAR